MKYEDGTLGLMRVNDGRSRWKQRCSAGTRRPSTRTTQAAQADPLTGELGELGFGTQELPVSGARYSGRKNPRHAARRHRPQRSSRRSLTPDRFAKSANATHDDILFSPTKTPEINVREVRLKRGEENFVVLENDAPAEYLLRLLE